MTLDELAREVKTLKDVSEIKDITNQYWYAIDTKNPDLLREVFAPGEIHITYEDMPVWNNRDWFVKSYTKTSVTPLRQENHFGSSPKIEITGPDSAVANWRLQMRGYNYETRTVMRVTGEYDLKYTRTEGAWKISSMIFKRHSLMSENIAEDGSVRVPDFGGVSADASVHLFGRDITAG